MIYISKQTRNSEQTHTRVRSADAMTGAQNNCNKEKRLDGRVLGTAASTHHPQPKKTIITSALKALKADSAMVACVFQETTCSRGSSWHVFFCHDLHVVSLKAAETIRAGPARPGLAPHSGSQGSRTNLIPHMHGLF